MPRLTPSCRHPTREDRHEPLPQRQFAHSAPRLEGEKPIAAPAVRLRAREAGVDLRQVHGTGPAGRITHEDLDTFFSPGPRGTRAPNLQARSSVEDIKVTGLRRRVAERMAISSSRIPHITYVEEVDVTGLEELRETLNKRKRKDQPRTHAIAIPDARDGASDRGPAEAERPCSMTRKVSFTSMPACTSASPRDAGRSHGAGGQAPEALRCVGLRGGGARGSLPPRGTAPPHARNLCGSTITITSLGAIDHFVTTAIINHPEVAIIGVNKIMVRPFGTVLLSSLAR